MNSGTVKHELRYERKCLFQIIPILLPSQNFLIKGTLHLKNIKYLLVRDEYFGASTNYAVCLLFLHKYVFISRLRNISVIPPYQTYCKAHRARRLRISGLCVWTILFRPFDNSGEYCEDRLH